LEIILAFAMTKERLDNERLWFTIKTLREKRHGYSKMSLYFREKKEKKKKRACRIEGRVTSELALYIFFFSFISGCP
jgi:hypothetical protein